MPGRSKLRTEVDALGDLSQLSSCQLRSWRKRLSDRMTQMRRYDTGEGDEYEVMKQKYEAVRDLLTQRASAEHASASSGVSTALGQIISLAENAKGGVAQMDDAAADMVHAQPVVEADGQAVDKGEVAHAELVVEADMQAVEPDAVAHAQPVAEADGKAVDEDEVAHAKPVEEADGQPAEQDKVAHAEA
eukprot:12149223-Karenia_brevis.AAC.1